MKEKYYTAAAIAVIIPRVIIGFAVTIPALVICAMLDRFTAELLINAGHDRDYLEGVREAVEHDHHAVYRKYSNFS